ncbi:MAG: domain containing protein [Bacteroidetes bacterium]|nr:domain containing protein [Bacteroidota bacterium]
MKRRNRFLVVLLFFTLKVSVSFAQIDTAFWFAAPWVTPDHHWKDNYVLHISSFNSASTTVRLRQPSAISPNRYDTTIILGPNQTFDYIFWRDKLAGPSELAFDSLEVRPANTVLPYGFYISSTSNITLVYDVVTRAPSFYNPETFSLKGQNGLGLEFVCPFQTKWFNQTLGGDLNGDGIVTQPKQQINIVASQPNTVVWITPKCNVVGHPANVTYSVLLTNYGSAYTIENAVQNTNIAGNNLSGSVVVADKPISVTVADDSVRGVTGCFDLMGDQIVPVDIVGTDYILNKGFMNAAEPDGAYIVATDNFTQITINDGVTTTTLVNKGDTYFYKTTQALTYVNATKPVYCLHATGNGCELGEALLPPLNCAGSNLVAFSRNTAQNFHLNILCKNGAQSTFTLNNATSSVTVPITAADFTVVPGTATLVGGPYYGAQLNLQSTAVLPVGSYTIGNNTDVFALGVIDGGTSTGTLFHYMSSFLRKTFVQTTTVTPVCVGQSPTVALTGTVSGGAITGIWTTSNGTGTFSPYTSTVNTISTIYTLSNNDTLLSSIDFFLTSTGNCTPKTNSMTVTVNQRPKLVIGSSTSMCKNNIQPIVLTGTVSNALGGTWSGGNGGAFGSPGVNTTYTPSAADLAANSITLTLTTSGPLPGCLNSSKSLTVGFVNPLVVSAGPSTYVCTNSQTLALNGSVTGFTNTGLWNTNGTGIFQPGSASPSATYVLSASDLSLTSLSFTLVSTNNQIQNCNAVTDNMVVNIIAKPSVTAASVQPICASSLVVPLSGTVSGSANQGFWSTPNGTGVFTQIAPANASYTMSANDTLSGNVTFVLGSTGTVCPTETDTIKLIILKAPVIQISSSSPTVCNNTPISLTPTITGATSYIWNSISNGTFTPLSGAISASTTVLNGQYMPSGSDVSNGSVVLTLTASTGSCSASKTFTVGFQPSPKANFNFSPVRCKDSPVVFTDGSLPNGTSNLSYNWNFGVSPTSVSSSSNPIFTYTNVGSYIVTFTVTGTNNAVNPPLQCPDTTSKRITIYPLPLVDFSFNNTCQGLGSIFRDSSRVSVGNVVAWTWQFGDGTPNVSVKNPVHTYTNQGTYNVALTATSNYSCQSTLTKLVTVNPAPNAEFGMTNNPSVAQEPVYFSDFSTPTNSITNWYWAFGDEGSSTASAPIHSYSGAGIFVITLTVFDNNGCSDTISKSIEITLLPQVPTAFTPNNDNNNDLLFVKGGPFEKMVFRVYDSWGVLMFETTDQKTGWDGKKDGVDQPLGVYVWTLQADMYNNRQVKKNGDVTLIR